jgi:hypothetical protein
MMAWLVRALVLVILAHPFAEAETPVYAGEPSGAYFQEWLLLGPFPLDAPSVYGDSFHLKGFNRDFLAGIGGEKNPAIAEGVEVAHGDARLVWTRHVASDISVDLDGALTRDASVTAYAYCEIESVKEQVALLSFGSNDGARVWLNGERVWDHRSPRGLLPDEDKIVVALRKGRNTLLTKIEERGGSWGVCARLLPLDADTFAAGFEVFRMDLDADGAAVLRFIHPPSVRAKLVPKADLEIWRVAPRTRVWRGEWNGEKNMVLPLPHADWGHYELRVAATLLGGTAWKKEVPFSAGKRTEHVLFDSGATDYSIVLGEDASESETWAAGELARWLKEVSGAEFPVLENPATLPEKAVVVGHNRFVEAPQPEALDESFVYRSDGSRVFIYGGAMRGTMYGVFDFLEEELGLRWYTPTVTATPQKARYAFDTLYHGEAPGVRVRNDFYFEAFDPEWAARNKMNGRLSFGRVDAQLGGVESYYGVHTFNSFVPPGQYFAEHPEYFSLIDGERSIERSQLCLTNPDVLQLAIAWTKKTMRGQPEHLIYSVSQNDWHGACECDACQAIVTREESESGPLIWFVNQVAEAVEADFPDKFVGTLAYQYTRKPCKNLRPRENVVIRLCSIECCFSHDFVTCPENETFVADLQGWSAIAPHMYIWDYVVNFSHYVQPYPNFNVLQSNIKTLRDNNAIGIMEQASYQSRGGEFSELRAYVLAELLWDPECDAEAVLQDFMVGYYGRSGQFVREYFDLLHARVTPERHIGLGLRPDDPLFSDAFVVEAGRVFDKAEAVADNAVVGQRVEMARLPLLYLKCKRMPKMAVHDGSYKRFCEIVKREKVLHYAEAGVPHREDFHRSMDNALR